MTIYALKAVTIFSLSALIFLGLDTLARTGTSELEMAFESTPIGHAYVCQARDLSA